MTTASNKHNSHIFESKQGNSTSPTTEVIIPRPATNLYDQDVTS